MRILYNQEDEATEISLSLLQSELHKIRLTQLDTAEQKDPRNLPHLDFTKIFWYDESCLYVVHADIYQATLTATPMILTEQGAKPENDKEETVLIAGVDPDEQDFERNFAKEVFHSIHHYLWG